MIFAQSEQAQALITVLAEKDLQLIREGRYMFVDQRQLEGRTFQQVIICYARTDGDGLKMLEKGQGIYNARHAPIPEPGAGEERCKKCSGIMAAETLYEGTCVVCWATEAKRFRTGSN